MVCGREISRKELNVTNKLAAKVRKKFDVHLRFLRLITNSAKSAISKLIVATLGTSSTATRRCSLL